MKATLHSIHSPDVQDLDQYSPQTDTFSILLQLLIGPDSGTGKESFDIEVCSPSWLDTQALPMFGRHLLIVAAFDFGEIRRFLETSIAEMEADSWDDLALKLSRFGHWEFEDYDPQ